MKRLQQDFCIKVCGLLEHEDAEVWWADESKL
jgi:hypothetical protein